MKIHAHLKEKPYFIIMVLLSCLIYGFLFFVLDRKLASMLALYGGIIMGLMTLMKISLIGHLRGNSIKVTHHQFPEVFKLVESHCSALELNKVPDVYIMENGGILNALALKFAQRDYVVIYSDVLALAYQEGKDALSFIIGHELGHIKMNHTGFWETSFIMPARFIPLLGHAYARACEYTCDAIGYSLCPQGSIKGLLVLAAGSKLYTKINVDELLISARQHSGFVTTYKELISRHPLLINRIAVLQKMQQEDLMSTDVFVSPRFKMPESEVSQ